VASSTILIASNNKKKLKELKEILGREFSVVSLKEAGIEVDVVEDAGTFAGNAMKKAVEIADLSDMLTLADDSGLCVNALGGRPGVYSARYAGEDKNDYKNNTKLLSDLEGIDERSAKFVSVICIASAEGALGLFRGEVEGAISHEMKGEKGFGYDPIFVPKGFDISFAQMDSRQKNAISHRKKAIEKAADFLRSMIQ